MVVAYLDQQIWSNLSRVSTDYQELQELLNQVDLQSIVFPYSSVHIQELAATGRTTKIDKLGRQTLVEPQLSYMKRLSNSTYIEASDGYTKAKLIRRDPFEAFETFVEVELPSASIDKFIDIIPKSLVRSIRNSFQVDSKQLFDRTESEAIAMIESGIVTFIDRCANDHKFYLEYLEESKNEALSMLNRSYKVVRDTTEEAIRFIDEKVESANLKDQERELAQQQVSNLRTQLAGLETDHDAQAIKINSMTPSQSMGVIRALTFEQLTTLVASVDPERNLPASFYRVLLLDLFGFKSKLKNRRSDHFDALHRELAKFCTLFVTDDTHFQMKLGILGDSIPGTNCQLLDSSGLRRFLEEDHS